MYEKIEVSWKLITDFFALKILVCCLFELVGPSF